LPGADKAIVPIFLPRHLRLYRELPGQTDDSWPEGAFCLWGGNRRRDAERSAVPHSDTPRPDHSFAQIALFALQSGPHVRHMAIGRERRRVQEDIRTTQEIFGDLFGGLASLGARGVDGFVIAKALARLLIQQGIIQKETFIATMREVAREELEESDEITHFLSETFTEILDQLALRAERTRSERGTDER